MFGFLSVVDVVVLVALLLGAVLGFWTGFVWQIIRLASVVVSLWITWIYHPMVADAMGSGLSEPTRQFASAIAVFAGMLLLCYLVTYLFRDLVNALKPQLPDRVLGGVFGLCKTALLVGVIAFLVLRYAGEDNEVRRHVEASPAADAAAFCARTFLYLLPDSVQRDIAGVPELGAVEGEGLPPAGDA